MYKEYTAFPILENRVSMVIVNTYKFGVSVSFIVVLVSVSVSVIFTINYQHWIVSAIYFISGTLVCI